MDYSCLLCGWSLGGNQDSDECRMVPPFFTKMKKPFFIFIFLLLSIVSNAQITEKPLVDSQKSKYATIQNVSVNSLYTAIWIDFRDYVIKNVVNYLMISPDAFIEYISPSTGQVVHEKIIGAKRWIDSQNLYKDADLGRKYDVFTDFGIPAYWAFMVLFPPIESEVSAITVNIGYKGLYWKNVRIEKVSNRLNIEEMEIAVNDAINESTSPYAGKYKAVDATWELAFVDADNHYALLNMAAGQAGWEVGDVWAGLSTTAYPNVFTGVRKITNVTEHMITVTFDKGIMNIKDGDDVQQYIKIDGNKNDNNDIKNNQWSGTGFALKNGFIVTNYHVVSDAKSIEVYGVNGDMSKEYHAIIIGIDKVSDLALLKIENMGISKNPPYSFKSSMAEVGESVYVLGYPLIQTMGDEVKVTNGIISAKSGFDGDITTYQISVPVQPGNSGGPLFDMNGNLIGVICAKHTKAENVSYAIKSSYLKNLIESVASPSILPSATSLMGKDLSEHVKQIKNYIYMIKCSK